jgi:hypothetical protein
MFCPSCGKRQIADTTSYCTRCGFKLESTRVSLLSDRERPVLRTLSPRTKGVLQGLAIIPGGLGAWLLLDILFEGLFGAGMMGGLYAMVTLIALVAMARIVYAVTIERPDVKNAVELPAPELQPQLPSPAESHISVTESTTRDLSGAVRKQH